MEYVKSIIAVSVVSGIISITSAGFRLSGTVKLVVSLIMCTIVILPLTNVFSDMNNILDFDVETAPAVSAEDIHAVYIEKCKEEIERRLVNMLETEFENSSFDVSCVLDTENVSAVEIIKVIVDSEVSKTDAIKTLIKENTGCSNIEIISMGEKEQ